MQAWGVRRSRRVRRVLLVVLLEGDVDEGDCAGGKPPIIAGSCVAPAASCARVYAGKAGEGLLGELPVFEGGANLTRSCRVGR
jgi:hypothetical protein